MNSLSAMSPLVGFENESNQLNSPINHPNPQSTPSTAPSCSRQNTAPNPDMANPRPSSSASSNAPASLSISDLNQLSSLIGNLNARQETKTSFSSCSSRFNGGRNTAKVEDFIATILIFKEAENIPDERALLSLPLLFEGYASTWWQGVQYEAKTFNEAIELLRNAFSPPKPDWRIYSEIFQDKQRPNESTDAFVCRKRSLFAQLKERLPENTIINMIFSQISIPIREKIPRESVSSFQELLYRARDIEMSISENKMAAISTPFETKEKGQLRCSYCRKKNHTADVCYKRIEMEKRGKPEETKLSCYGCGAVGYYRSNCPTCNNRNVMESPKLLDFNSVQTTLIGHNVPTVDINVNGLNGEAYLDTAARTSIAGYHLFQKLVEMKEEFQKVYAEITLADGIVRKELVCSTVVKIIIGKRLKRIRFICLPNARNNRTLLGIDFLEQAGMVMDLAQKTWYFKDAPKELFSFKAKPSNMDDIRLNQTLIENKTTKMACNINDFMAWFESNYDEKPPTLGEMYSKPEDYSPGGLLRIFRKHCPMILKCQSSQIFFRH